MPIQSRRSGWRWRRHMAMGMAMASSVTTMGCTSATGPLARARAWDP